MARVDLETPRDSPAEPGLGSKYCNILICSRQRARAATSLGSSARAPTMCLAARRPARQPCFYTGWRVVLACFLVQMASAPPQLDRRVPVGHEGGPHDRTLEGSRGAPPPGPHPDVNGERERRRRPEPRRASERSVGNDFFGLCRSGSFSRER